MEKRFTMRKQYTETLTCVFSFPSNKLKVEREKMGSRDGENEDVETLRRGFPLGDAAPQLPPPPRSGVDA